MTDTTACATCQRPNPASATFCDNCGQFLGWPDDRHPIGHRHPEEDQAQPHHVTTESVRTGEEAPNCEPDIHTALQRVRASAERQHRDDLARHLTKVEDDLRRQTFPVVVCGEFKVGKSSLINALLRRQICPVDPDVVTAVPTTIAWAPSPSAWIYEHAEDGRRTLEQSVPLDDLQRVITSAPGTSTTRVVEVGLPHRMLKPGLALVDTPGAGGLDSAEGVMTLHALRQAHGVLFVTDAAQELTRPELEFLTIAAKRAPSSAIVITKTDLHQNWRRIRDLNEGHLHRAGLVLPIIPVSSLLRIAATGPAAAELNTESGFEPLIRFIAATVNTGREQAAAAVRAELSYVTQQLHQETDTARIVRQHPDAAEEVVAEVSATTRRAERLTKPTASWQQLLNDGLQDLAADVEFDLSDRIRNVTKNAEELIDHSDPKHTWPDTETWLRRQVALAAADNRDLLTTRTRQLAADVADNFNLEAQHAFTLHLPDQASSLTEPTLPSLSALSTSSGSRVVSYAMAARSSYAVAMLVGAAAAFPPLAGVHLVVVGLAALIGVGIGGKLISGDVTRQRSHRQQQAKTAARRWIDDVALRLSKQTREQIRTAHRQLRDEFQLRAEHLHRSALSALEAAHRASNPTDQRPPGRPDMPADAPDPATAHS